VWAARSLKDPEIPSLTSASGGKGIPSRISPERMPRHGKISVELVLTRTVKIFRNAWIYGRGNVNMVGLGETSSEVNRDVNFLTRRSFRSIVLRTHWAMFCIDGFCFRNLDIAKLVSRS
jgi:hypothetical protein